MRWLDRVMGVGLALGALAVALLMLHVIVDSSLRTLFDAPLRGTIEIASFWWLVGIAFLPLAASQQRSEHLTAPVLYERLTPGAQRVWRGVALTLTLLVVGAIAYYGWGEALGNMRIGERTGAVRTLVWPTRFLIPLGAGLWAVELARQLLRRDGGDR